MFSGFGEPIGAVYGDGPKKDYWEDTVGCRIFKGAVLTNVCTMAYWSVPKSFSA